MLRLSISILVGFLIGVLGWSGYTAAAGEPPDVTGLGKQVDIPQCESFPIDPFICDSVQNAGVFTDSPFYVLEGWSTTNPDDSSTYFELEFDDEVVDGEVFVYELNGVTYKMQLFVFPAGLTGAHRFSGHWYWEAGLDYFGHTDVTSWIQGERFVDDDGSIFEEDIEWLAAEGATSGCNPPDNDRFCAHDYVTRGQMAKILIGTLDRLHWHGHGPDFVDIDDSVFEEDILRIAEYGITLGCNPPDNDRFCPDDYVTRGQMAAFVVRAMGYTDDGGGDLFVDTAGSIFKSDIDKLATAGVTKGCNPPDNTMFCPTNFVTRGQIAAFLHRALG